VKKGARMKILATALFLLACAPLAHAVQPDEILPDPALETRARTISRDLRCLVCQNQSIDDSDAEMARDLRLLVRERLKAGDNDQQVLQHITDRFGNFVRLDPPMNTETLLLWISPFLVLGLGGLVAARHLRAKPAPPAEATTDQLSDDDRKRIAAYLDDK
jgi:cytochrome c-type biogenesis protein CcmH